MAEYASASIFRQEWRDLLRWKQIKAEIGEEPSPAAFCDPNEYQAANAVFEKKFSKTRQFVNAYNSKVKDSTTISRQVETFTPDPFILG